MSQELIYTSAPSGVKPGSRGFCTVVATRGMAKNLVDQLEDLSGYRHLFLSGPETARNPVAYSHLRITAGGRAYHVLSRVADAGLDYTRRSNKLAHHVALEQAELPAGGPGWLLSRAGWMTASWSGAPQLREAGPAIPAGDVVSPTCREWQRAAGDSGWAGVVAAELLTEAPRPIVTIYRPGFEMLPLVAEVISLLPAERRWSVTFSTFFTKLPPTVDCRWRSYVEGTPEAETASRLAGALVLDLRRPLGRPPETPEVAAARAGKPIVAPSITGRSPAKQGFRDSAPATTAPLRASAPPADAASAASSPGADSAGLPPAGVPLSPSAVVSSGVTTSAPASGMPLSSGATIAGGASHSVEAGETQAAPYVVAQPIADDGAPDLLSMAPPLPVAPTTPAGSSGLIWTGAAAVLIIAVTAVTTWHLTRPQVPAAPNVDDVGPAANRDQAPVRTPSAAPSSGRRPSAPDDDTSASGGSERSPASTPPHASPSPTLVAMVAAGAMPSSVPAGTSSPSGPASGAGSAAAAGSATAAAAPSASGTGTSPAESNKREASPPRPGGPTELFAGPLSSKSTELRLPESWLVDETWTLEFLTLVAPPTNFQATQKEPSEPLAFSLSNGFDRQTVATLAIENRATDDERPTTLTYRPSPGLKSSKELLEALTYSALLLRSAAGDERLVAFWNLLSKPAPTLETLLNEPRDALSRSFDVPPAIQSRVRLEDAAVIGDGVSCQDVSRGNRRRLHLRMTTGESITVRIEAVPCEGSIRDGVRRMAMVCSIDDDKIRREFPELGKSSYDAAAVLGEYYRLNNEANGLRSEISNLENDLRKFQMAMNRMEVMRITREINQRRSFIEKMDRKKAILEDVRRALESRTFLNCRLHARVCAGFDDRSVPIVEFR